MKDLPTMTLEEHFEQYKKAPDRYPLERLYVQLADVGEGFRIFDGMAELLGERSKLYKGKYFRYEFFDVAIALTEGTLDALAKWLNSKGLRRSRSTKKFNEYNIDNWRKGWGIRNGKLTTESTPLPVLREICELLSNKDSYAEILKKYSNSEEISKSIPLSLEFSKTANTAALWMKTERKSKQGCALCTSVWIGKKPLDEEKAKTIYKDVIEPFLSYYAKKSEQFKILNLREHELISKPDIRQRKKVLMRIVKVLKDNAPMYPQNVANFLGAKDKKEIEKIRTRITSELGNKKSFIISSKKKINYGALCVVGDEKLLKV